MLKRPSPNSNLESYWDDITPNQAALSLCSKFNSILEERLFDGKSDIHRIMSIDVNLREFDLMGFLSSSGKEEFWKEVDTAIKKFDMGQISLRPHNPLQSNKKNQNVKESKKLPTPPPKKHSHS